ncbi:MAG TPA: hypothetical protein VH054_10075 [Polyangiaceae bacterium]|jgi:hypothetical protein|nr:hypothetical protein [Polyangiaceae bacterium]
MNPTDLTIEILKNIHAEIGGLRGDFREMNARVERMERRQVEADIRVSTEIVGVAGVMQDVRDLLRDNLRLRPRLEDHERRIFELEKKKT